MALTQQQAAAVAAEGNVLVMAGAGTGKTSTLVARVASRLVRPGDPVPADRVLMVTFTEAAAAEMRSRLRQAMEATEGVPADQIARLELATIGTLHAFCLQLLREHGTLLGLEPQVAVLDEVETGRIAAGVWRRRVEGWLTDPGEAGAAFRRLLDGWFDGDLQALWETVRDVAAYARTLADPEEWLAAQERHWSGSDAAEWRRWLEAFLPEWAGGWAERLARFPDNRPAVRRCGALAKGGGIDRAGLRGWLDSLAEDLDEYTPRRKTVEREPLKDFFEEVEFLRQLAPGADGVDPLDEDWAACAGPMRVLLATVRGFGSAYADEKRVRGGVDFQDLEQFALRLLREHPEVAAACRERFEMVVVDECQDLNAAQEAILRAVSREGARANRFLVGDVKQSIYRFRLADPHLFQATADAWSKPDGAGRVIPLTGNFRSAESLLAFANTVCGRLFRREVGGVEYGLEAALQFGDPEGRSALSSACDREPRVEWHVGVKPGKEGDSAEGSADPASGGMLTPVEVEARRVARRLREMKESGLEVWDRGRRVSRPVRWSDMAVLLRAERGRVDGFAAAFREAGVPLVARQNGFFSQQPVLDLRALLRILDNPLQDIPLLTVLRSPLAGGDEVDGLAAIRLLDAHRDKPWWTLLQLLASQEEGAAVEEGGPGGRARAKVRVFLGRYEAWRRIAIRSGAAAVLEAALDDTGYEAWAAAEGDGGEAVAQIRRLLEMARQFDRGSRGGLYRFLVWLDSEEAADRVEPAGTAGLEAVQLMTVHRSKGLEFPVVAVAGLGTRFQMMDLSRSRVVRDEKLGLCPLVVTPGGKRYPSLALWLAQRRQRREMMGEELRLLYVALTRAADRLLLFGTASEKAVAERWGEAAAELAGDGSPMTAAEIESASTPLDWLGPLLARGAGAGWGGADSGEGEGFRWRIERGLPAGGGEGPVVESGAGPAAVVPEFSYPHAGATREPAKVTATGLRRRMAEEDGLDVGRRAFGMRHGASDPRDGTAVERGVALHRFMEVVDPAATGDEAGVRAEMERVVRAGLMTAEEAGLLDVAAIARFWASELGVRIRERSAWLEREVPFTVRLTAADLRSLGFQVSADLAPDEFVVGQGVVDLALVEPDGIRILDFKTDRVGGGRATREKAEAYRPQLAVYALALSRIHGRPVTGRWLHFLETGETVEV